jgi:hypothetical protein
VVEAVLILLVVSADRFRERATAEASA